MKLLKLLAAASVMAMLAEPTSAAAQQPVSAPQQAQALTIERVFDSPSLNGPVPRSAKLSPDGRYLALLRNRAERPAAL